MLYVDVNSEDTRFAGIRKYEGHPNAENLFGAADCILSELQKSLMVLLQCFLPESRQRKQCNTKLLCQHCLNHYEVEKSWAQNVSVFVEETIEVHQSLFHAQRSELTFDEIKGYKVIHYHNIQ